ncbi:hypothetical protein MNBD_GAMMA07-2615 [hydrothermal vent metagenome]|uniref:Negative regulator of flagellin synthesis n=1 Tax=hydrothermal vent metagenome TaxID=652676 RepID=A0A3B0X201_9ZZZZ
MANPINPLSRSSTTSISSHTEKAPVKTSDEKNVSTSHDGSKDTVSLSQESKQVSSLQLALKDSTGIDEAKVESIKQEIANGNYPLDAEKTAENFINLEQTLLE